MDSGLDLLYRLYARLGRNAQTRFYVCYAVSVGAAMGAAFSANLFTLYLFYEIVSIFTYPLVMHHQDKEGYEGARKYIIYLMFTSRRCAAGHGDYLCTDRHP